MKVVGEGGCGRYGRADNPDSQGNRRPTGKWGVPTIFQKKPLFKGSYDKNLRISWY